jgi:hypothetical protein
MPDHLWVFCGPGDRGTISEALKGCVGKPGQDSSEVIAHRDVKAATAFDYSWSSVAPMLVSRENLAASEVDGIVYAIGGDTPNLDGTTSPAFNDVEQYLPSDKALHVSEAMTSCPCRGFAIRECKSAVRAPGCRVNGTRLLKCCEIAISGLYEKV